MDLKRVRHNQNGGRMSDERWRGIPQTYTKMGLMAWRQDDAGGLGKGIKLAISLGVAS